jgi:hypothetical protein
VSRRSSLPAFLCKSWENSIRLRRAVKSNTIFVWFWNEQDETSYNKTQKCKLFRHEFFSTHTLGWAQFLSHIHNTAVHVAE